MHVLSFSNPGFFRKKATIILPAPTLSMSADADDISLSWENNITTLSNGCKIVVLGSSTAAGTGATTGNGFVAKMSDMLTSTFSGQQVTNLAQGGFTSYELMPTGTSNPAGKPAVNTTKNVTAALALNPDLVMICLPSNDLIWPHSEFMANLQFLYNHITAAGKICVIESTQPTDSNYLGGRTTGELILSTYGQYAFDAYNPLAGSGNTLLSQYSSPDDATHLNDAGHLQVATAAFACLSAIINATNPVSNFVLERSNDGSTGWSVIASPIKSKLAYLDADAGSVDRYYRIKSVSNGVDSNYSNIAHFVFVAESSTINLALLSELAYWYRANNQPNGANAAIETLTESSANGHVITQVNSGQRATIRNNQINTSLRSLEFVLSDAYPFPSTLLPLTNGKSEVTLIMMIRPAAQLISRTMFYISRGNANNQGRIVMGLNSSGAFYASARRQDDFTGSDTVTSSYINQAETPVILSMRLNLQTRHMRLYANYTKVGESTDFATAGTFAATNSVGAWIGASNNAGASGLLDTDVFDFLMAPVDYSDTTFEKIINTLNEYYALGLTGGLN